MSTSHLRRAVLLLGVAIPWSLPAQGATAEPRPTIVFRTPGGSRRLVARPAPQPVVLDGVLDEAAWAAADKVTDFVQSEPNTGAPATEATEVRVLYDATTLYIGATMHDRNAAGVIVNDIRKDFTEGEQDDFEVLIDTFHDGQNGFVFITNAEGARADRQIANEGRETNTSWDAVWSVRTRRTADGWTAELAIPFRALRYDLKAAPVWGINFARRIRRKNELDFWSPVSREFNLSRVSLAGMLDSIGISGKSRDLRIKPYVAGRTVRALGGATYESNAQVGVDLKYGITQGLTLDATVNPDFAQVEADEQQVNLTQFSLFFPEKREFFLENSGIFYVGDAARNNRVTLVPTPDEDLLLFFSRRVGLDAARLPIGIPGGIRLTGQTSGYSVGALSMNADRGTGISANNYSVLRLRKNIGGGSDVGMIAMSRQSLDSSGSWNRVVGVDANIRYLGRLDWNSYLIATRTPGVSRGQYAYRTSFNYESPFFHGKAGLMELGDGFADDLGFFRRTDMRKYLVDLGVRPRPQWARNLGIREMHPHLVWNYYENTQGQMVGKLLHTGYTFFLSNGGFAELSVNPHFELITAPFTINPSIAAIPAGNYPWTEYQFRGATDGSRPLSAEFTIIGGGLWSGTQRSQHLSLTVRPNYHLSARIGVSHTEAILDQPKAAFEALLWTGRVNYSFTTNMFLDALAQYDPRQQVFNANVRFNVIHHPLSDVFIVLNEQRITNPLAPATGRSLVVKVTQMVSF